jgi:hypothetical protein
MITLPPARPARSGVPVAPARSRRPSLGLERGESQGGEVSARVGEVTTGAGCAPLATRSVSLHSASPNARVGV